MLERFSKHELFPCDYHRIESPKLSTAERKHIGLDKADTRAIGIMMSKANSQGHLERKKPNVRAFFDHKKLYKTR